jgi:rod shape-determining protein MreD
VDKSNRGWVIALSFVVAFMLTAAPLPDWALPWRPAWIAMVLVYWCMALPERVGVLTGWMIGLVLDVMHGSILGQHAFGLAFVAYIAVQYHQRVRVFPLMHQALFVASVIFIYLVMMLWIYNVLGSVRYGANYLLATLTTAVLWPWVFIILRDVRRRAKVV